MNRLAGATSPYLRQHAENPVDWYPWGDEAFARARDEDKPLFVSVGYAACHWCHVMAHESFEDEAVATDLARAFVAVKVDREERPDVDDVYMAALQATTGSGGWPMSVFCTPDGRPFFAGTYFPPSDRAGMPSFRRVLAAVADAWATRRAGIEAQADALAEALAREARAIERLGLGSGTDDAAPRSGDVLAAAVAELEARYDERWGGWGAAPKFPRPSLVELCLRHHLRTGDAAALAMATGTLDHMAAGGLYDHLEGGFARYSTDARWLVPHFEKMLTDQVLLARAYLRAWQVARAPRYLQVVTETLDALCETMAAPHGGFCASLDADAGGVEGGHVTWTRDEVRQALTRAGLGDRTDEVCAFYGIDEGSAELGGRSVPHRPPGADLARPPDVEAARRVLLAARRGRPQPGRDDKVLTEWNAMAVAALADAGASTGTARWLDAAEAAAELLFERHRRADGRWLRAAGGGVPAFAGDHAWVVQACLRLAAATGRAQWLGRATETADALLDLFVDDATGSLFTTGHDAERLVVRTKDVVDGALPSANAVGAQALLALGALTGEARHADAGARILERAAGLLAGQPTVVADMVAALALADDGAQVVVAGDRPDLVDVARAAWLPDAVVAWGEPTRSPLWEGRAPGAAYVCRHFACDAPARDAATLAAQLVPLGARPPG